MIKKVLAFILFAFFLFMVVIYFSTATTDKNFSTCEILDLSSIDHIDFREHDSVMVAASTLYRGNTLKNIVQGEQYRKVWETPVKVPIAFLDTLKGGLTILEQGGGKQTHSLKVKTKNDDVYTLRSVTKNPEPLIPDFIKAVGLENIVVDGISAQHPYAALAVAELAHKCGLLSTRPQLLFLPRQEKLDSLNDKYGNRLFLFEHENAGNAEWTQLEKASEIIDTEDLQELKSEKKDLLHVDENLLVRARLFDLLIGDWDRHAKQWGWVLTSKNEETLATPLPCDRDNAFFNIDGILPTLLSHKSILPDLQNFEKEIDYIPGLVMDFDTYFLKTIDKSIFSEEATYLQSTLTDESINQALKVWPKTIYEQDGAEIAKKIMARKQQLTEYAMRFKEEIDKTEFLSESLKGSEDLNLPSELVACFDCLK
ncbi:hypothetical protein D1013_11620 [Euzebyella marina]|uniref:Uncharacterized protein n=1 Tax=Euzebyella marina TaxID=1761453 RepID=A0A3G2L6R9_9FLAO|nr:hypothetical protein [Euzebyella marina]AYN67977.1 hypothetical protein D1013_11620 [Euzebyella marina]